MSMLNILSGVLLVASSANGISPDVPKAKWTYEAKGTLYAAPLVADVHPEPGKETMISDAEVRRLRCISATGRQLWEYDGRWRARLTSRASLSVTARPERATLLIGGSDGRLCCVDGATGRELWAREVGGITWGSAIWTDLDGDGRDDAVAGTEKAVVALDLAGRERWTYRRAEGEPQLEIGVPLAACDVDGDGKPEILAVDRCGVVCLDSSGKPRWHRLDGGKYCAAAVIADGDADGRPELYCGVMEEPAVVAVNALNGETLWSFATLAPPGSLAPGDVNRDGREEVIVGDEQGRVYALRANGKLLWSFQTSQSVHAEVTLGDVDGDGDIETLVASWDHWVYCLDSGGNVEWRCRAERRILGGASITDVDEDGKTDVLFCGSDHRLRCVTLDGAYDPSLIPWPSSRFDAAQSGAAFARHVRAPAMTIVETRSLLVNGGFEKPQQAEEAKRYPQGTTIRQERLKRPLGWHVEPVTGRTWGEAQASWELEGRVVRSGKRDVRVDDSMLLVSSPMPLGPGLRAVSASVFGQGSGASGVWLRWSGARGVLREDKLARSGKEGEWDRFAACDIVPPPGAAWVTLVCRSGDGVTRWDDAEVRASHLTAPKVEVLVNQVGYDVGAPKRFTVQCNFKASEATFVLLGEDDRRAFSGKLADAGRIKGHFGSDWGWEYYRGDFSGFDGPGRYRIEARFRGDERIGIVRDESYGFEIGKDLVWAKTARAAYRFFYYQRCGTAVPGYHAACHLDDGIVHQGEYHNLSGGWHDAGDYNTYHNAPYVYGIARAYGIGRPAFDRLTGKEGDQSEFLREILWGGDHSRRMISPDGSAFGQITSGYGFWGPPELETDNRPGTGDERGLRPPGAGVDSGIHQAAMARIAALVEDKKAWIEAADRGLRWALANNKRGVHQFSTAVDLCAATGDKKYAELARALMPKIAADETVVDAVRRYDALTGEDHSEELCKALIARAEDMLKVAANPFGVVTFGPADRPNFFGTPAEGDGWRVGTNSHLAQSASLMALAHGCKRDSRYLAFVHDQINWILGNNPFNVSLMEGAGSAFVPTYHTRLMFAGVPRGAVPGSVINGVTWRRAGEDVPFLDMSGVDLPHFSANECWLPHNTNYLNALANLMASRRQGAAGRP
ncbi:MAG: glycoside hydrolase family 9 protein [Phycisphaerae bacterium]|nr:glycoside hydrolase family 9 protein [Phycisphaerae bacterium]